jgi:hypothetical protein
MTPGLGSSLDWLGTWLPEELNKIFFVRSMVFGIVQLVCSVVPRQDVTWIIAVPQQHATFELFGQTGARSASSIVQA